MQEDTKNTEEHFRVCVQWTCQLSIYRSAVPNPLFSACSVITEIQGTIDIFIVLMIILVYKYVVSFYLLKSFIPFPFYSFLYRVLYSLSEMYSYIYTTIPSSSRSKPLLSLSFLGQSSSALGYHIVSLYLIVILSSY